MDLMVLKPNPYNPIFLQCFDTVGWVILNLKNPSPDMSCVRWDIKPYLTYSTLLSYCLSAALTPTHSDFNPPQF